MSANSATASATTSTTYKPQVAEGGDTRTDVRCRSDEPHLPETIKDHVVHYTSCLKHANRLSFWGEEHPVWKHALEEQFRKLKMADSAQLRTVMRKATVDKFKFEVDKKAAEAGKDVAGETSKQEWKDKILKAEEDIEAAEKEIAKAKEEQKDDEQLRQAAAAHVRTKIRITANEVRTLYRRAKIIREAIDKEPSPPESTDSVHLGVSGTTAGDTKVKSLDYNAAKCTEQSLKTWREQRAKKQPERALEMQLAAKQAGAEFEAINAAAGRDETLTASDDADWKEYDVEKDMNAHFIQFARSSCSPQESSFRADFRTSDRATKRLEEKCKVLGTFPNQKVSMHELLGHDHGSDDPDDCVLNCEPSPERIKYIHIPSNNMSYVEKSIAKYYGEAAQGGDESGGRPKLGSGPFSDPMEQSRSYMLLRPQFWRGQQHGSNAGPVGLPIHARHLRPMVQSISSTPPSSSGRKDDSIALFMPFLHWEYDRRRFKIAAVIDQEWRKRRAKQAAQEQRARIRRQEIWDPTKFKAPRRSQPKDVPDPGAASTSRTFSMVANVASQLFPPRKWPISTTEFGRTKVQSSLGQYLLDVARLYETLDLHRDRAMIQRYLSEKAPLHPRRTLDQSYYWTLRTTKEIDRDQVVYRGTNMDMRFAHRLTRFDGIKQDCKEANQDHAKSGTMLGARLKGLLSGSGPGGEPRTGAILDSVSEASKRSKQEARSSEAEKEAWRLYGRIGDHEEDCQQCRNDVTRSSRVVMVDQLWMWILDKQTIITCFPRRYGWNKKDSSGVFKAVRKRLEGSTIEIRSVFDFAIIVLRECTNTLLDRSQPLDQRPQVMDIFAEAIGRIDHKLSIQFARLWDWTERATKVYKAEYLSVSATEFYRTLLDINPEGKLQKEIRDIIDELSIIIAIKKKQQELITRFIEISRRFLKDTDEQEKSRTQSEPEAHSTDASSKVKGQDLESFNSHTSELQTEIENRIGELEALKHSAQSTAQDVTDLLTLKQQQAGVVQAWQAVKQGEETVKQSRSIVLFTVVTIFFLPLSFMSSIFGMNNTTFTGEESPMTLQMQMAIMFPASALIIVLAVWVAFSKWSRTIFWAVYKLSTTIFVIKTHSYHLRLRHLDKFTSTQITEWTENKIKSLKDRAQKDVNLARAKQRGEEKKKAEAAANQQNKDTANGPDEETASNPDAASSTKTRKVGQPGKSLNARLTRIKLFRIRRARNADGKSKVPARTSGLEAGVEANRKPNNASEIASSGGQAAGTVAGNGNAVHN